MCVCVICVCSHWWNTHSYPSETAQTWITPTVQNGSKWCARASWMQSPTCSSGCPGFSSTSCEVEISTENDDPGTPTWLGNWWKKWEVDVCSCENQDIHKHSHFNGKIIDLNGIFFPLPLLITRGSQGEVLHHHAPSCGLQDHTTTWLSSGMTWLLRIFPSQHLTECHMKDDNVMILYIYTYVIAQSFWAAPAWHCRVV